MISVLLIEWCYLAQFVVGHFFKRLSMDIFEQFQKDFDAQFSDMKAQAKPYTAQELYDIDYDQGMKDAEKGIKHEPKSEAYTQGYGDQYAYEQTIDTRVVI